ncbi:hypothetical protein Ddc_11687 [Ditylenchus destructor]|nr:hypothetical protein Ddc_11687 [Ditylenchus destructor]
MCFGKNQRVDEKNQIVGERNQKMNGKNQKVDEKNQKAAIDNRSGFTKACCALCPCCRKKKKEEVKVDPVIEAEKKQNERNEKMNKRMEREFAFLNDLSNSNSSVEDKKPNVHNVKLRCKKCKWTYKDGIVYENDEKGRPANQREADAVEHYMFEWNTYGHDFKLEMERKCKRVCTAFDLSQSPPSKGDSHRTEMPYLCYRCRPPPVDQPRPEHLN